MKIALISALILIALPARAQTDKTDLPYQNFICTQEQLNTLECLSGSSMMNQNADIRAVTAPYIIQLSPNQQEWPAECDNIADARRIIDHRVWTCRDSKLVPLASTITGPIVNVKLTDHDQTWYEPLIVPHRTADRAYWTSTLLSLALTVADVENSRYALAKAGTVEANGIFGHHPGRATYYGITMPIFAVNAIVSYRYKREDDALAFAGIPGHRYSKWWLPNAINNFGHAAGTLVTLASTGR